MLFSQVATGVDELVSVSSLVSMSLSVLHREDVLEIIKRKHFYDSSIQMKFSTFS